MTDIWGALRVVVATAVVVVMAAAAARLVGRRGAAGWRGRHLSVVDSISLGSQRGLFMVQAAGRVLIIGASREGLTLLGEMTADELGPVAGDEASTGEPGASGRIGSGLWARLRGGAGRPEDPLARGLSQRLDDIRRRAGRGEGEKT